jgi:uncharacterized YccA/Bax inhibitor family protein
MKHIKKALIDSIIIGGIMLIFAAFQKSTAIYGILIPITIILCFNFIRAAFGIYHDKKNSRLN